MKTIIIIMESFDVGLWTIILRESARPLMSTAKIRGPRGSWGPTLEPLANLIVVWDPCICIWVSKCVCMYISMRL